MRDLRCDELLKLQCAFVRLPQSCNDFTVCLQNMRMLIMLMQFHLCQLPRLVRRWLLTLLLLSGCVWNNCVRTGDGIFIFIIIIIVVVIIIITPKLSFLKYLD